MWRIVRSLLERAGMSSAEPNGTPSNGRARQRRLIVDAILLGVVGAVAAQLFMIALRWSTRPFLVSIAGYHVPGLPSEGGDLGETIGHYGLWLIPLITTLGGLIVGLLVEGYAPEAEGHGTDAVDRPGLAASVGDTGGAVGGPASHGRRIGASVAGVEHLRRDLAPW